MILFHKSSSGGHPSMGWHPEFVSHSYATDKSHCNIYRQTSNRLHQT